MTVESVTYISDLNATYPAGSNTKSEGDNHIRNLKTGIKNTFPNVSGAVTPTHTELNYVDGVTSAIQTQLDAKAPTASPTFTGTPAAPTAAVGTNTTQLATTAFVTAAAFAAALPSQTGNSGKVVTTDGSTASWTAALSGVTINNAAIGGVTPAAGAFTTLAASGTSALAAVTATTVAATGAVTTESGFTSDLSGVSGGMTATSAGATFAPRINLQRSRGSIATKTVVSSGDDLGSYRWAGYDGSNFSNAGQIRVEVDGTPGASDMPGRMIFSCSPDGTASPTEYMRITNAGVTTIGGSTTTCALNVTPVSSSTNYVKVTGATTGNMPSIASAGSDTNVGFTLSTQGTGSFTFSTGGGTQFRVLHVASAVGYIRAVGAATGGSPYFEVISTDTNAGFQYYTQGTGSHQLRTGGGRDGALQFQVTDTVGSVNYCSVTGNTTGNHVTYGAGGSDTNIPVRVTNKGTAIMQLYGQTVGTTVGAAGGASALPANPRGYITLDINGTGCKIPYYNT